MPEEFVRLDNQCCMCGEIVFLSVRKDDYDHYKEGMSIEDALPKLTEEQRIFMVSNTCGKCFNKYFGGE